MHHRIRRVFLLAASTLACSAASAVGGAMPPGSLFGFTADQTLQQKALEQLFDGNLNPNDLSGWLKNLSSEANQVGSPHDKANAEFVRDQLKQWGWDAQIEVFYPLYPTLKSHTLERVAPTKFVAGLGEPEVAADETSKRSDGMCPY